MTEPQRQAIERHGRRLLAIYPHAPETDPVMLCKKLRRIENKAHAIALQACNGPEFQDGELDARSDKIHSSLDKVLSTDRHPGPRIDINLDARGFALKIDSDTVRAQKLDIYQDWGGYGIIAPEIGKEGN